MNPKSIAEAREAIRELQNFIDEAEKSKPALLSDGTAEFWTTGWSLLPPWKSIGIVNEDTLPNSDQYHVGDFGLYFLTGPGGETPYDWDLEPEGYWKDVYDVLPEGRIFCYGLSRGLVMTQYTNADDALDNCLIDAGSRIIHFVAELTAV